MPVGSKIIALLSTSFHLRPFTVLRLARYPRHPSAAFSSAAVFHGRLHSVFNLPKLAFWSSAANLFHSEAVISEGCGEAATSFSDSKNSHPWPEWSKLADLLVEKGCSDRRLTSGDDDDSFLADDDLPVEFLKAAEACLSFSRDRPDILRLLSKKNIEPVVLNGSPFLFKNGESSARRMKLFLSGEGSSELEREKAQTIDIMRYILSYVYGSLSLLDDNNLKSDELVERSVRKLLCELFNLSGTVWKPKSVDATLAELPLSNEHLSGNPEQYVETRSSDSIYPKIPDRSSAATENQPSASFNWTDKEYGKSFFNQKQVTEVTPSSQTEAGSMSNGSFIANSARPSTSVLDKNVESWNSAQASSPSNAQISNEANAAYGSTNSSQPPNQFRSNHNSYYGGCAGKPTQPSANLWTNSSTTYGGSTSLPSSPPGNSRNSTKPSSNSWSNNSRLYGESTLNSSQLPSSGYLDNYSTRYDNTTQSGFTTNSSPPPNNSWNTYNTSPGGFNEKLKQPSSNSYSASAAYSPQPPNNSRNNYYNAPYGENVLKSNQPSSNHWSNNNTSFGGNSWNNHSTNSPNSTEPSANSRNLDKSRVGFNADSYRGHPSNSNQSPSYLWNNSSRESCSGFPQASNGLPSRGQTQNAGVNLNNGYSGKSLEGSCVTEPDPLDMSEEAKAERWFRRAAQIKDISELSQIPDEDFPQIMPMRKGVNRFVVSKRKTPLERRLASQQYKRSLPVVSSEPEKETTAEEKGI